LSKLAILDISTVPDSKGQAADENKSLLEEIIKTVGLSIQFNHQNKPLIVDANIDASFALHYDSKSHRGVVIFC
jgi:hypothetical protein